MVQINANTFGTAWWRARERAAKKQPSVKDLRVHDLRHAAATRMGRATGNLQLVQKMLGHKRITTSARYAHVSDSDLRDALNRTHVRYSNPESHKNPITQAEGNHNSLKEKD